MIDTKKKFDFVSQSTLFSKTDLEITIQTHIMTIFQTLSQLPGAVPEPSQDENWKDYAYEFIKNLVPAGDEYLLDYFDNFSTSQIISIANLEDLINLYNQYNWIAHNNIIIQIENDLNDEDDENDEDYQEMPDLISEYDSDEETQEYTANEPEQEETDSDMDIDTDEEDTDSNNEDDNSNMDIETDDDEEEEDATEPIHYNITDNEIFFVMQQTDSSYESAVNAINQYNGDIPLAISSLYNNQPENEIINDEDDLDIANAPFAPPLISENSYYAGYDNTNNDIIEILDNNVINNAINNIDNQLINSLIENVDFSTFINN